jgi:multidrug resistance efflux pump
MDIPRERKPVNRVPLIVGVALLLVLGTVGVSRLRPAAPQVERATLWIDTVKRGDMLRQVRGNGTLVPEDLRIVSAMTAGRVERVVVRPGARVEPGTVLLELTNPDVQLEALDAERQVKLAEAELAQQRAVLESQRLAAVAAVASARRELSEAERQVKVAERLASEGLASSMEIDRARDAATEARERHESEKSRLTVSTDAVQAQLALRASEVDRLRAIARFQQQRVASMTVRAGQQGVLQTLRLQPGEWVNPGAELARVAGQDRLKAVVRVPETQARDLSLGLKAEVDTRNGIIAGRVSRVDPSVQNGTVAVDIELEGALPKGARPDLTVDATIEIERLTDVVFVGRPAEGSSESTASLFVLASDGRSARRVAVRLGRGSVNAIEVLDGLAPGDQVILSEMTRWEQNDRVRLQ